MNKNCFEIGTIQAFLDGETTPEMSLRLTDHVASCDTCAFVMAEAEEENSVVFSALEREIDTLVPTQRLWSRINEGIAEEKSHAPFWQKALAYVRLSLANPSIVAAAGIILVVGLFTIIWMPGNPETELANNQPKNPISDSRVADVVPSGTQVAPSAVSNPEAKSPSVALQVNESNLSPQKLKKMITTADLRQPVQVPNAQNAGYLPGEESYVKTIADLKQNVDDQKDTVLTPSTRVSYERDMAVVNDSIKRMRDVVKKNPRNQAARQVLYSSYQDKIDLLNSVAQREELIASLK